MPLNGHPAADAERPDRERPPKRRRIGVACIYCRTRKSRCDGHRPSCGYCASSGLRCTYEQGPKSVKKSNGEYDHRLKAIEETLQQLVQTREDRSDDPPHTADFSAASQAQTMMLEVADAQDPVNDDPGVDGLATVNGSHTDSQYFGPSSNIAFLKVVSNTTSAVLRSLVAHRWQRRHDSRENRAVLLDNRNNLHETLTRLPSPAPAVSQLHCTPSTDGLQTSTLLPTNVEVLHLLGLYFSNTGVMFPFISERRVYASYNALNSHASSGSKKSVLCVLNAIFALATLMSTKNGSLSATSEAEADVFYHRARALIPRSYQGCSDIETVQYLILLSQYCQNTQRPEETWSLHGLAVQAAVRIGLPSTSRMNSFSGVERELRKRLWFGCFILDRTLSMTLGRPPIVQERLGNMELPLDMTMEQLGIGSSSSPEYNDRPYSAPFFIATIQLYKVLGSIISNLYDYNLDEGQSAFHLETTKAIASIENDLDDWRQNLPSCMLERPWDRSSSGTSPPHDAVSARLSAVTHLRYLNVRILLHRPVLQHLLKQKQMTPLSPISQHQPILEAMANASAAICQDCAVQIIAIVCKLSKTMKLLGARWFSIYYTFNASLVIFSCLILEPNRDDLVKNLKMAVEATERLDTNTQISRRVLKILHRLISMSESLSEPSLVNEDSPNLNSNLSATAFTTSHPESCDELGLLSESHTNGEAPSHVMDSLAQILSSYQPGDMGTFWPLGGTQDNFLGTLDF